MSPEHFRPFNEAPRVLMCPPDHFNPIHLFNPWLRWDEAVDIDKAQVQWRSLKTCIENAGGAVEVIDPDPDAPAMTFTRDAALPYRCGNTLILRNDGPRGDVEPALFAAWFDADGCLTEGLPPLYRLDGGNIVRCADGRYLIGIKPGSAGKAERYLARLLRMTTGARSVGIPLAEPAYLHLDMVLADLGGRGWLLYRDGLGDIDLEHPAWQAVFGGAPIIDIELEDARQLGCNVLMIDDTVIASYMSPHVRRAVASLGLKVIVIELTEFVKAGGAAHCLTLEV